MKNFLYATTGIVLAMAVSGAASADVDILSTITKDKTITVDETVTVTKTVDIWVGATYNEVPGAAEAQTLINVDSHGNTVNGTDASDPTDQEAEIGDEYNLDYAAIVNGSVNTNNGVFGFNQDVGNMSNQGNVVSVSGITGIPSFADAQAHAEQINTDNTSTEYEILRDAETGEVITDPNTPASEFAINKYAAIQNSINGNTGVINVNQNSGNMNNQSNGVAIAVGLGAVVALSDTDLGQQNSGNTVDELSTVKVGSIANSVNGNSGIVNVNQSTGNMNNQGNVVSFAAITSGAILDNGAP